MQRNTVSVLERESSSFWRAFVYDSDSVVMDKASYAILVKWPSNIVRDFQDDVKS